MLPVAEAWSFSDSNALLVLWMTSHCHIMEQMDQNQVQHYVSSSLPDGGTSWTKNKDTTSEPWLLLTTN